MPAYPTFHEVSRRVPSYLVNDTRTFVSIETHSYTAQGASVVAFRALYIFSEHAILKGSSMRAEVAAHAEEIEQSLELLRRHL